jgi:hypothetical protein
MDTVRKMHLAVPVEKRVDHSGNNIRREMLSRPS